MKTPKRRIDAFRNAGRAIILSHPERTPGIWSRRQVLGSVIGFGIAALNGISGRRAGAREWVVEPTAGPFRCHASFALQRYAELFTDLDSLQAELVRTLGIRPAVESIDLFLLENRNDYRALVHDYLPNAPDRRALFIRQDGRSRVFAYRQRELPTDVRHECTHALLHAVLDMVPLWLDEGLAEYFEMAGRDRAYGNPHLARVRWDMRLGILPRLADLEAKRQVEAMGRREYRFAWAWVHFMLHGPVAAHRQLVGFLADIATGTPPGQLSQRLEGAIPNLQLRLVQHFKHWRPG